jgi:transposase-like protein
VIRALVLARRLADEALQEAVRDWLDAGNERSLLATELGVDRTTLYRRYVWTDRQSTRGGQGRPKAGEAHP